MKYTVRPTSRFQKDLKRIARRGYNTELLTAVIKKLAKMASLLRKNIVTMRSRETTQAVGNVTSHRTGCSSMKFLMTHCCST